MQVNYLIIKDINCPRYKCKIAWCHEKMTLKEQIEIALKDENGVLGKPIPCKYMVNGECTYKN